MHLRVLSLLLLLPACVGAAPEASESRASITPGPSLAAVCPPERSDELCLALRASDSARARAAVAARVAAGPRDEALRDPALRWFVRERAMTLLAWNAAPADVGGFFTEYFPAYPAGSFPL